MPHPQARPVSPHGVAEVFAVELEAVSLDQDFPAAVFPGQNIARVEPQGILQLASAQYSAVEGTLVSGGGVCVCVQQKLETHVYVCMYVCTCVCVCRL